MKRNKKYLEDDTREKMKALGVYKPEYEQTIAIYAGMLHQYMTFCSEFEKSRYKITELHTNRVGAVNERKVPLYVAMESLRKDIITYINQLGLSPKALESITANTSNATPLARFLKEYDNQE